MELFFLLLLVALVAVALAAGYPVAFALPGSAIISIGIAAAAGAALGGDSSLFFTEGGLTQWLSAGVSNFRGLYWGAERDTLIAIPLFIFMGVVLQRSKIAEDLLIKMAQLFGPVPGGLGISVVFVGALLAATTGIVGATVVAMGLISLPAMMRHNYSKPLATGTIAASGTLGQIIPPSIVLIILADQLANAVDRASNMRKELYTASTGELTMPSEFDIASTSAGEMFVGAMVPGLVLVGLYMAFILGFALLRPGKAPPVPFEGRVDWRFLADVALVLVPPLTLIFLVLGSIIGGVATVNQAGAIGAAGTLIMAGYRLKPGQRDTFVPLAIALVSLAAIFTAVAFFNTNIREIRTAGGTGVVIAALGTGGFAAALLWSTWRVYKIDDTLTGAMMETAKTTALVFVILMGAAMLTAAFRAFGGEGYVRQFLESIPGGFWSKFFTVMAVIFVLGFFLEFIEIAVVVVPIVAPILLADPSANVTAVWLGVMIGLNIQTSFLTPPFGFALFYLRGVAPPSIATLQIYRGVAAFIALQLTALAIIAWHPTLVNYLPNRIALTSEMAPPPNNPRLQYCIEEYVWEEFEESGGRIRSAIDDARNLDFQAFPEDMRQDLRESFEVAESTFELLEAAKRAESNVAEHAADYRPLHRQVRRIENDIRQLESTIERRRKQIRRARGDEQVLVPRWEEEIAEHEAQIAELRARIPDEWEEAEREFREHIRDERAARMQYRRASDAAYAPIAEALAMLESIDALSELRANLSGLAPQGQAARLEALLARARDIPEAGEVAAALQDARRALAEDALDEARARIAAALAEVETELDWRRRADEAAGSGLRAYEAAIRGTIGLRSQPRLPREAALSVAACSAAHRDISLSF